MVDLYELGGCIYVDNKFGQKGDRKYYCFWLVR